MRIAYFDAFSGIAGDMTVGALLDAGADFTALVADLDSLGTGARFRFEKTKRKGIAATKFDIDFEDQKKHRHLPHIVKMIEAADLPARAKQNAILVFETSGQGRGPGARHHHREGPLPRSRRHRLHLRHRRRLPGTGVAGSGSRLLFSHQYRQRHRGG